MSCLAADGATGWMDQAGTADGRAFGLAWEDCEELLHKLGFCPRVEVVAA